MRHVSVAVAALALFTAACSKPADEAATPDTTTAAPAMAGDASVSITSPAEGDSVSLPFTVKLEASGVEVIPANGTSEPGKGHHHLIVDGDFNGDTIPLLAAPIVIHMGDGSKEKVMEGLSKGPHRIISVFANGMHVPIKSVRGDTLNVIVR